MSRRQRKKRLNRAMPVYPPGGSFMYVPAGYAQSTLGQTFYGTKASVPTGQTSLFSPGTPLPPQPGVNPGGMPVQYRFPVSYNTFPVDRSQGNPDIPSFEQLRRLAKMYSGITLCERFWLDMVPRMTLNIKLKQVFLDAGAEEKRYQKEIGFFKDFFARPDGKSDLHTWIRKALREQTQVDELYIYKHRTRGGKLLGLWLVDGGQIKPLLDEWGMQPDPPGYAYQQYPWGIPGMQYSSSQMIHYQESPATDTPYGFSRVERVILEVNQALRKKRKDLAYFTEGNQPFSLMEVPESLGWTPDQIDAYEQSWNALIAGNAQQQVRTKFTQPGMKYIPVEQYQLLSDFDKFILNVCVAAYGISMAELSFTESVNRSSGESQEDMTYRRTIGPLAAMYGMILTDIMNHDFSDEMHGDMFEATFGGYEEIEDEEAKARAITIYTGAGILGLTDAAKMGNLPVDPDAPPIGRVIMTATGPIFLDDVAAPAMRKAQQAATLAGYKAAAHPPEPGSGTPQGEPPPDGASSAPPASDKASGDDEEDLDEAETEATSALGALNRFDPVHAYHGEFGVDGHSFAQPATHGHHHHGKRKSHSSRHHGPRLSTSARMSKLAARFDKLEKRALSTRWTAAQRTAAGKLEDIFSRIGQAITKGQRNAIDSLLDQAWSQAKTLFAGKPKGLGAMSRALTRLDTANEKGLLRAVAVEEDDDEFDELEDALDDETDDEDAPQTGMMVAFRLGPETAAALALPGGEPASDLHVTLAILGDLHEPAPAGKLHPAETVENLSAVLSAFAGSAQPLHGRVGGLGRFQNPDAESSPVIATVNAPGLQAWRRRLVDVLDAAGYAIAEDYDFLPHITLAYIDPGAPMPVDRVPSLPLTFDTLCLCIGNTLSLFPIGSAGTATEERSANAASDYRRWRSRAIDDAKVGRAFRGFTTTLIPPHIHAFISGELQRCTTPDEVRAVFRAAGDFGDWQRTDPEMQKAIVRLHARGVRKIKWKAHPGCDHCASNDGQVRHLGQQFPSGGYLPPLHPNCECEYEIVEKAGPL